MSKVILFTLVALIHIIIWVFVLLAFINIKTASINLYFVIPLIYILHVLPFHIIVTMKKNMYPHTWEHKASTIEDNLFIVNYFRRIQIYCDKHCFQSPFSAQGMLIFGALSSAFVLLKNCNKIK